jgi:hypothetical protein
MVVFTLPEIHRSPFWPELILRAVVLLTIKVEVIWPEDKRRRRKG